MTSGCNLIVAGKDPVVLISGKLTSFESSSRPVCWAMAATISFSVTLHPHSRHLSRIGEVSSDDDASQLYYE